MRALLAEAAQHLRPHGTDTFARLKVATVLGDYRAAGGQRYKAVARYRCWVLAEGARRQGTGPNAPLVESPILLLEDGTAGRAWLDLRLATPRRGEYVSTLPLDPLDKDSFITSRSSEWVEELKRRLATTIVRYERGG
ncbi:hypothetical protein [Streptomyces sp. NPDC005077]|uniref:hypothetical protein n=1 Tax=Streptomyces sp. NPDC005077 TaxID=3154292 RepID=UPI0033B7191F